MVLAQLDKDYLSLVVKTCFHPTMVLAQLPLILREITPLSCFHPTMVLAQPDTFVAEFASGTKFPSHYGSRSTQ